jgi:hypothetical protein
MIDLDRYFKEFESIEFAAKVNIASGFQMFQEIVNKDITYNFFITNIRNGGMGFANGPEIVLRRIDELINTEFDNKYENPYDVALAVYAMALEQDSHEAGMCAAQMLNDAKQIWWTRRVINQIQGLSL